MAFLGDRVKEHFVLSCSLEDTVSLARWCTKIAQITPALGVEEEGSEMQNRAWLHSKSEASLGYVRPCSKNKLKKTKINDEFILTFQIQDYSICTKSSLFPVPSCKSLVRQRRQEGRTGDA